MVVNRQLLPLAVTSGVTIAESPPWVQEAVLYLRDPSLGEEWELCVMRWVELERILEYGAHQCTRWNVTDRPAEFGPWLKWGRQYARLPGITDATSYVSRLLFWWNQLQPIWRRGTGRLPRPQYTGDWEVLRKGGKNGLLTVLIMFTWWGRCPMVDKQAWKAAADDIARSLQGMIEVAEEAEEPTRPKKKTRR
jgi:hypothetical protein